MCVCVLGGGGGWGIVRYSLVCLFPQCCHVLLSVVAAETTTTCVAELRALGNATQRAPGSRENFTYCSSGRG